MSVSFVQNPFEVYGVLPTQIMQAQIDDAKNFLQGLMNLQFSDTPLCFVDAYDDETLNFEYLMKRPAEDHIQYAESRGVFEHFFPDFRD